MYSCGNSVHQHMWYRLEARKGIWAKIDSGSILSKLQQPMTHLLNNWVDK